MLKKRENLEVFNLGKKNFSVAIFFVIGAKQGKLLRVREERKSVKLEFGGSEERVKSY